jgi:hypothetical protein
MKSALAAATATLAVSVALAAPAQADPSWSPYPPGVGPDAPKCMTVSGEPWPHPQLLPCGWQWLPSQGGWVPR